MAKYASKIDVNKIGYASNIGASMAILLNGSMSGPSYKEEDESDNPRHFDKYYNKNGKRKSDPLSSFLGWLFGG